MVDITLYAAPMEGLTTCLWRQAHREIFGGVDKYFTPFLSPNANLCFQRRELDEIPGEPDTVPQLLTNRSEHFIWAARNSCFMLSVPTTAPITAFSVRDRPYSASCWGVAVPRPIMVVTRFRPLSQ